MFRIYGDGFKSFDLPEAVEDVNSNCHVEVSTDTSYVVKSIHSVHMDYRGYISILCRLTPANYEQLKRVEGGEYNCTLCGFAQLLPCEHLVKSMKETIESQQAELTRLREEQHG